jgi:hypothetical protein
VRAFFYSTELEESVTKFADGDGPEVFLLNIFVKRDGDRIDVVPHPGTWILENRKSYVITLVSRKSGQLAIIQNPRGGPSCGKGEVMLRLIFISSVIK